MACQRVHSGLQMLFMFMPRQHSLNRLARLRPEGGSLVSAPCQHGGRRKLPGATAAGSGPSTACTDMRAAYGSRTLGGAQAA